MQSRTIRTGSTKRSRFTSRLLTASATVPQDQRRCTGSTTMGSAALQITATQRARRSRVRCAPPGGCLKGLALPVCWHVYQARQLPQERQNGSGWGQLAEIKPFLARFSTPASTTSSIRRLAATTLLAQCTGTLLAPAGNSRHPMPATLISQATA